MGDQKNPVDEETKTEESTPVNKTPLDLPISRLEHNAQRTEVYKNADDAANSASYIHLVGFHAASSPIGVFPSTPEERAEGHREAVEHLLSVIDKSLIVRLEHGPKKDAAKVECLKASLEAKAADLLARPIPEDTPCVAFGHHRVQGLLINELLGYGWRDFKPPFVTIARSAAAELSRLENVGHDLAHSRTKAGIIKDGYSIAVQDPDVLMSQKRFCARVHVVKHGEQQLIHGAVGWLVNHPSEYDRFMAEVAPVLQQKHFVGDNDIRRDITEGENQRPACETVDDILAVIKNNTPNTLGKKWMNDFLKNFGGVATPHSKAVITALRDGDEGLAVKLLIMSADTQFEFNHPEVATDDENAETDEETLIAQSAEG
jgi:hypothetical protein